MTAAMPPPPPPNNVIPFPKPNINNGDRRKVTLAPDLVLAVEEIAGKSIAVLGTTGSGKSTTTRKLLEELLQGGVPFSVADIENEYAALKELGEVIIAAPGGDYGRIKPDVTLENEKQCYKLGRDAYLKGISVVLMIGELDDDVRKLFLRAYITGMFEAASNPDTRRMHKLVLEEAHEYIPQTGLSKEDPLRLTVLRVCKRGRKRGVDLVLVSQRPANVDKDALTQCQIFVAHYVTYATDIATYKTVFKVEDLETRLAAMKPGDIYFQFGKKQSWHSVIHPKTASPSTTPGAIHFENFVKVQEAESVQEAIKTVEDREGMSVVPTAYLRGLEEAVPAAKAALSTALTRQMELEGRIAELEAVVPKDGESATLYAQNVELARKLSEALRARNEADKYAAPITLLLGLLEETRKKEQR